MTDLLLHQLALWDRKVQRDDLNCPGPTSMQAGSGHAVCGGRVRMRTGSIQIRLNEDWTRDLPRWKRFVMLAAAYPLRGRYGYL